MSIEPLKEWIHTELGRAEAGWVAIAEGVQTSTLARIATAVPSLFTRCPFSSYSRSDCDADAIGAWYEVKEGAIHPLQAFP
jgi:hypothetical protein